MTSEKIGDTSDRRAELMRIAAKRLGQSAARVKESGERAAEILGGEAFEIYHSWVNTGLTTHTFADGLLTHAAKKAGMSPNDIRRLLDTAWNLAKQASALYTTGGRSHWQPGVESPPGLHAVNIYDFVAKSRDVKAMWGSGTEILWAEGESLMIAAALGLGKTSLLGLLVRAQVRTIGDGMVLGQPVRPIDGRVLCLAMDRPAQAARSLARQFTDDDLEVLGDRVLIREGPPVQDMAKYPDVLKQMADFYEAEVVYVDSVKDAAIGLSDDDVGAGYNRARQALVAAGYQVCELHHVVKRHGDGNGGRLTNIADVYGSTWLTSGAGSVIGLSGEPNAHYVEFNHLRAPMEQLGPWTLYHDHETGEITIHGGVDLVELANVGDHDGITAKAAATALYDTDRPTRVEINKATYALDKLVKAGKLTRIEPTNPKGGRGHAVSWFPSRDQQQ